MAKREGEENLSDPHRLDVLYQTGLMDSPRDEAFERLTRLAARILHAPVALVSLVDSNRQFLKSQHGLADPWASRRETPMSHSFCQHTVTSGQPLVIADARRDPRLSSNLAVTELAVVAYVGVPLTTAAGDILGAFCVIDHEPRRWTKEELDILSDLAAAVMAEITLHTLAREAALQAERAENAQGRAEALAAERVAVLAQVKEGVIITDAQGYITFVNEEALRLHGQAPLNISVSDYATTYHLFTMTGEPYPSHDFPLARAVLKGETVCEALWRIHRSDGSHVVAQGSATPFVSEDGRRLGSVLVARDVTEQHDFEREREDFLAAAAHDLKNPLISVKGTAQLLQRHLARPGGPDLSRLVRGLKAIDTASTTMAGMIDELLDVSRMEAGYPPSLERTRTDLVALARHAADRYRETTDHHRILVVTGLDHLTGWWDAARLERVVGNLLNNALRYSPDGGIVVITVTLQEIDDSQYAVLEVTDEGIGIPAADLTHVFDRFRRGSNVTEDIPGTGIGLAAARQTVEHHGGTIAISSIEGHGTTVRVWLPLEEM